MKLHPALMSGALAGDAGIGGRCSQAALTAEPAYPCAGRRGDDDNRLSDVDLDCSRPSSFSRLRVS